MSITLVAPRVTPPRTAWAQRTAEPRRVAEPEARFIQRADLRYGVPRDGERRVKMSRGRFLNTDFEGVKAEWVDGEAILMLPARNIHGLTAGGLAGEIYSARLQGARVMMEPTFDLTHKIREPDLAIVSRDTPPDGYLTDPPAVVVEVLSPSTRRNDLGPKKAEYLAAGVGQYWVVDPDAQTITVLINDDGESWRRLAVVDKENPTATIAVAPYGEVTLRHSDIFLNPQA